MMPVLLVIAMALALLSIVYILKIRLALQLSARQIVRIGLLYCLICLDLLFRPAELTALSVVYVVFLLSAALIDYYTSYIYDILPLIFAIIVLLTAFYLGKSAVLEAILGGVVGLLLYGIIYLISYKVYGYQAFGLGDVFLLASIGLYVGPGRVFIIGMGAFYTSLLFIFIKWWQTRHLEAKSALPFGPAIALTAYLVSFHYNWLFAIYQNFQQSVTTLLA